MAGDLGHGQQQVPATLVVQVVWTRRALEDLRAIHTYIDQFAPLAAQRMALRLKSAADWLGDSPSIGRSIGNGRRELVTIAPYLIRYRIKKDRVEILTIRHGARRPDDT